MSTTKFIAFDFGAESGRSILGTVDGSRIRLEEIHRFPNRQVKVFDHIYWDLLYLFDELKKGLAIAVSQGHKYIRGIGVDTWGVDFGLIGRDNQILGNPFAYRDSRTDGMMEKAFELMPKEQIYATTGIQFMQFNSIFQLFSMVVNKNPLLEIGEQLLFMPDLINFLLTGERVSEYTIASTSQLLNAKQQDWEPDIFDNLNLPIELMAPIIQPGSMIGRLLPEIMVETGIFPVDVIAPGCHDTASAVAAVPARSPNWAYLSSGTWSLLGVETMEPIINDRSMQNNFTNEGGVYETIRFLRNTMGLWLLQRTRQGWHQQGENLTYDDLTALAADATPFKSIIDPDDQLFLNPPDMPSAIIEYCKKTGQDLPQTKGEFIRCIFESLALKYRYIIDKINTMRTKPIEVLHIVGGGSQNDTLNQFSANATGLPVIAGPVEATAIGNILIQAIAKNELNSLEEGRELVANSFPLKYYEPGDCELWNEIYEKCRSRF